MIKILVIGNGFDKAHGLKTGYGDFLDWFNYIGCSHYSNWGFAGVYSLFSTEQQKESIRFGRDYPKEYKECIDARYNFWIAHFNAVRSQIGDLWLDFETEIEVFIKKVYDALKTESVRSVKSKLLKPKFTSGIDLPKFVNSEELFKWLYEELREMTRLLEIYLCEYANKAISSASRMKLFTNIKANRLLSFNYTSTYQDVYNKTIKTDYIHGKALMSHNGKDSTLVLGYDDHYIVSADTIPELIPFEKYYQRIVYRNSHNYFDWLEKKDKDGNAEEKEVHFYGHSFSPADGDVIKILIEAENTKTKIYYRKDYEQDRAMMIKNLAMILTPNELIKRISGVNPTIELISV